MPGIQPNKDLSFTPYFGVVSQARQGVARALADEVAALVGLTDKEMAYILGMTPRNLHYIKEDQRFGTTASERLLLLKNVLLHALETFNGKPAVVLHWLRSPNPRVE